MKSMFAVLLGSVILVGSFHASAFCSESACDLNGDGVGSKLPDYAVFLAAFGSKKGDASYNPKVDFDNSGSVTVADFAIFQRFCPLSQQV